jgi:hypothetical protein
VHCCTVPPILEARPFSPLPSQASLPAALAP